MLRCCKCGAFAIWRLEMASALPEGLKHGTTGSIHRLCDKCRQLFEEWIDVKTTS